MKHVAQSSELRQEKEESACFFFVVIYSIPMAGRDTSKKPAAPKPKFDSNDDDWDTDLTFEVRFPVILLSRRILFLVHCKIELCDWEIATVRLKQRARLGSTRSCRYEYDSQ